MLADHVLRRVGQIDQVGRELRRPDHVGLVDVDVGVAGRQPELVLAELVRRRRRHRHDCDLVAGLLLELVEHVAQELQAGAGVARHDRQVGGANRTGAEHRGRGDRSQRKAKLHDRKTSLCVPNPPA
jgi:hypothetical protein